MIPAGAGLRRGEARPCGKCSVFPRVGKPESRAQWPAAPVFAEDGAESKAKSLAEAEAVSRVSAGAKSRVSAGAESGVSAGAESGEKGGAAGGAESESKQLSSLRFFSQTVPFLLCLARPLVKPKRILRGDAS